MQIHEVLNSKNYIVEDDRAPQRDPKIINDFLANAARVGSPGAKDPEVIAKSRAIFVSQPNLSADEAFSIAKGQINKKNNRGDKPKRKFASARVKDTDAVKGTADTDIKIDLRTPKDAGRKRGAQIGNQNARKNFGDIGVVKGLKNVKDVITKGTLDNLGVSGAATVGSDLSKDTFKGLDSIAQTRDPKRTGNVFGS